MLALLKQSEKEEIDWLEFKLINFNEDFELTGICKLVENEPGGNNQTKVRLYFKIATLSQDAKAKIMLGATRQADKPIIKFR